jgi:CDP-paratose 2-epimerase
MTEVAVITGGAGFVGTNLALTLARAGRRVVVLDNLSRSGVDRNLEELIRQFPNQVVHRLEDVKNPVSLIETFCGVSSVFHFAAQVAVTGSMVRPRADFEENALGTLNVPEAVRTCSPFPRLVFTSTNKVYGDLGAELIERSQRWEPSDPTLLQCGVAESQPLDFRSPYGCSKGAADQYVLDYARSYGIPAVVFRMSCIYGPHQCGNEDQGWLAHFARRALAGEPITLYGDGKQVRDALYVEDLMDALLLAEAHASRLAGQAFNIGGGPEHTTSLLELLDLLGEITGKTVPVQWGEWRTGDQRWYVSDSRRFQQSTGWHPSTGLRDGVSRLCHWLGSSIEEQNSLRSHRNRVDTGSP